MQESLVGTLTEMLIVRCAVEALRNKACELRIKTERMVRLQGIALDVMRPKVERAEASREADRLADEIRIETEIVRAHCIRIETATNERLRSLDMKAAE